MLRRCSGVIGGEAGAEEGAKVGEVELLDGGRVVGSNSLSGIGGERSGLRVIFSNNKRRDALERGSVPSDGRNRKILT